MMEIENSPEYLRKREAREREMAERATMEEIREIHLALAENYRLAAEEAEQQQQRE